MTTAAPGLPGTRVDAARVWAGGVATALVAALAFAAPQDGRAPKPGLA